MVQIDVIKFAAFPLTVLSMVATYNKYAHYGSTACRTHDCRQLDTARLLALPVAPSLATPELAEAWPT